MKGQHKRAHGKIDYYEVGKLGKCDPLQNTSIQNIKSHKNNSSVTKKINVGD